MLTKHNFFDHQLAVERLIARSNGILCKLKFRFEKPNNFFE